VASVLSAKRDPAPKPLPTRLTLAPRLHLHLAPEHTHTLRPLLRFFLNFLFSFLTFRARLLAGDFLNNPPKIPPNIPVLLAVSRLLVDFRFFNFLLSSVAVRYLLPLRVFLVTRMFLDLAFLIKLL
jgi:hypothetical protein